MSRSLAFVLLLGILAGSARAQNTLVAANEADPPVSESELRCAALDLAGAFTNDGYKLRDGFWFGQVSAAKPQRIAVNLFGGNQYWFCAATKAGDWRITVYDSKGTPVEAQTHADEGRRAAGIGVLNSGQYFVEISSEESTPGDFCFMYLFK